MWKFAAERVSESPLGSQGPAPAAAAGSEHLFGSNLPSTVDLSEIPATVTLWHSVLNWMRGHGASVQLQESADVGAACLGLESEREVERISAACASTLPLPRPWHRLSPESEGAVLCARCFGQRRGRGW